MNQENNAKNALTSKRDRLVEAAGLLFQKNGFVATSLADIAKQADIPIGNVYYYFKAKDELAMAALEKRGEHFTKIHLAIAENIEDVRERLLALTSYFAKQSEDYAKNGCLIGKIISDLDVSKDAVARKAVQIMEAQVEWIAEQFLALGYSDEEAKKYAKSFMVRVQGASVMAKIFGNEEVFADEMTALAYWIESLPNKKIQLGKVRV